MTVPPVVVEIAAPDRSPELDRALLDACSRAVRGTACVASEEAPDGVEPSAVAILSWQASGEVRVEVAILPGRRWVRRQLSFDAEDAAEERWRAAGLAVGVLAGDLSPPSTDAPAAAPGDDEPPPAPPPPRVGGEPPARGRPPPDAPPLPPPASTRPWLELAATGGPGFRRGPWRRGGIVGGVVPAGPVPALMASSVGFALRPRDAQGLEAQWWTATLGVGRSFGGSLVRTMLRAEGLVERLRVAAMDAPSGTRETAARWSGGVRGAADVALWWADDVAFFVGADGRWLAGTTSVHVRGAEAGEVVPFVYSLAAGCRVAL